MSLRAFEGAIESELLRGVVRHWSEVKGARRMPAWEDIRPSALKAQIPIVWAWKFDRGSGTFTGRLAGERIQSVFGTTIRGARMSDIFFGREYEKILARHTRVVKTPAFFRGRGLVFHHLERFDRGERIILPLAGDGMHADGIIGATEFSSTFGPVGETGMGTVETEEWFGLD